MEQAREKEKKRQTVKLNSKELVSTQWILSLIKQKKYLIISTAWLSHLRIKRKRSLMQLVFGKYQEQVMINSFLNVLGVKNAVLGMFVSLSSMVKVTSSILIMFREMLMEWRHSGARRHHMWILTYRKLEMPARIFINLSSITSMHCRSVSSNSYHLF